MELDKFIKMVPGKERKVANVDLHDLTFAFQADHHTVTSLKSSKAVGGNGAKGSVKGKQGGGTETAGPGDGEGGPG